MRAGGGGSLNSFSGPRFGSNFSVPAATALSRYAGGEYSGHFTGGRDVNFPPGGQIVNYPGHTQGQNVLPGAAGGASYNGGGSANFREYDCQYESASIYNPSSSSIALPFCRFFPRFYTESFGMPASWGERC